MEHSLKSRKWVGTYLEIAKLIAQHSRAKRDKVGAVLVKDNRIISIGYNGTISGFDNKCENEDGMTKPEVLHAESNCITKCAKSTESSNGAALYVTLSPCYDCCKLIIQSGISEVYFLTSYRDSTGLDLLRRSGIQVYSYEI